MPDFDCALDDDIGDELLRLIFTACHPRLSREARAALALRMICGLTTGGDRARLSRAGGDDRPAHRARQADAVGIGAGLRNPARRGAFGAARLGAGGRLSHFQRGLYRRARRRLAAPAALQRSASHGPRARFDRAAGAGGARHAGADGAERLAAWRRAPMRRASRSCCWSRTVRCGTGFRSGADCRRWRGRANSAAPAAFTRCRLRSSPAMRRRAPRMRPTGRASLNYMRNWLRSRVRRSSN